MTKKPWQLDLVLLFCGALLFCWLISQTLVGVLHHAGIRGFRDFGDFGVILLMTMSFQGAICGLIPAFIARHEMTWREVFGLEKVGGRLLAAVLLTVVAVLPVAFALEQVSQIVMEKLGWAVEAQAAVQLVTRAPMWPTGLYLGIFAVVLAPVAEEFVFRGVLYPLVKQCGSPRYALFGVSAIFAEIHFDAGTLLPLFALALALTWLYEKTGSLLAPILAHSLFNSLNLVGLHFLPQINEFLDKLAHHPPA